MEECNKIRWLLNDGQGNFTVIDLATRRVHIGSARANLLDKYIIMSGGMEASDGEVSRFTIDANAWETLPSLHVPRFYHASCSLGDDIYVFCGLSLDFNN